MSHDDILMRFAKVFHLTYTRFLDLQNAEIQAREAQIEAVIGKSSWQKQWQCITVMNLETAVQSYL